MLSFFVVSCVRLCLLMFMCCVSLGSGDLLVGLLSRWLISLCSWWLVGIGRYRFLIGVVMSLLSSVVISCFCGLLMLYRFGKLVVFSSSLCSSGDMFSV